MPDELPPHVNDLIEVLDSPYAHIEKGDIGVVSKVFERGVAVYFINARHPMSTQFKGYPATRPTTVWLAHHTQYKIHERTKVTDAASNL